MENAEQHLPIGSRVGRYRIERVLGIGGFGVTYLATDTELEYPVALKEFMPDDCAVRSQSNSQILARTNRQDDYQYGLDRFLDEAKTLAKFKHPNIVRVVNFLKANNTAYLVMDYEEGEALDDKLKRINHQGQMVEADILAILKPMLKGLSKVHSQGLLHRDIKPGNIYLRQEGEPMLIDFGAARYALGSQSKSISAIISMGYAPPEQYSSQGKQGVYSDLYALGATVYQLMSGKPPAESPVRREATVEGEPDPMAPAASLAGGYSQNLCAVIDWCLRLSGKQRPQSAAEVLTALGEGLPSAAQGEIVGVNSDEKPIEKSRVDISAETTAIATRRINKGEHFAKKPKPKAVQQKFNLIWPRIVIAVLAAVGAYGWLGPENSPKTDTQKSLFKVGSSIQDSLRSGGKGPYLMVLPKGSFQMGCLSAQNCQDNEKPVHIVNINYAIAMMITEVTFDDYQLFTDATGRRQAEDEGWGRGRRPVINVSWNDAVAYAKWISQQTGKTYRLPSEAEWEYAARAASKTKYSWGNDISCSNARYGSYARRCSQMSTASVANFRPNKFGLFDLHGNVIEWVADCSHDSYQGAPSHGKVWSGGDCKRHVMRGGSWYGDTDYLRSAYRTTAVNDKYFEDVGFRLVQDLNP